MAHPLAAGQGWPFMSTPFFTLQLCRPRDFLVARQRTRHLANLLGFDPADQALMAAAVFEVAFQACRLTGCGVLHFEVEDDLLRIFPGGLGQELTSLRVEKPLPQKGRTFALADLAWIARELNLLTPLNLLEEVRRQNQELLQASLRQASQRKPALARKHTPAA